MKKLLTMLIVAIPAFGLAQWSNTTNLFVDSLHMPVCTEVGVQETPIVLQSYPDGGYFVIWQDRREGFYSNTKIYAQKYDVNGNRLWANNGVPVASGNNAKHFTFSSNQDYRNRSIAATDSAGGFYVTYADDSVTNYVWQRACVQHMRSNGTAVFSGAGYIVASSNSANLNVAPQLIADGNKGFFMAYKGIAASNENIYVYCYKDENGTMKSYGGGKVNENAVQRSEIAPCGIRTYVLYPGTNVLDYNIWPDGQGGCNVIMDLNGNVGEQYRMLAFNKVWRAKKTSLVTTYFRNPSGSACPKITPYKSGDVYVLYTLSTDYITTACGSGSTAYVQTSYRLLSNGYQLIDGSYTSYTGGGYDYGNPKGVTIATAGSINVDMIAVVKRTYKNNVVSNFTVQGYAYPAEKYDSIPFQRTSYINPEFGYNPTAPPQMNQLNHFRDTLLAAGNYFIDFSLAGGGNKIYAAGLMSTSGDRLVRLQHLSVEQKSAGTYAVEYKTGNKHGTVIGKEINTGFGGSNISYDVPQVTVSNTGTALFYIREYYRSARVSPIFNGAELAWGAMGKPISTGIFNGGSYNLEQPHVALNASGSSGVIGWRDNKSIPGNTGENIFMRHIDSLDVANYQPPVKLVKLVPNPYGGTLANPAALLGTSNRYSTIEYSAYNHPGTPMVEILDNFNFGRVQVSMVQNSSTIRRYNNQPYLDRNFTIIAENNPAGATINLRLYFTTEEFNALKSADASIATPADLSVIKQPNNTISVPLVYAPIAGEQVIKPIAWKAVAGGYYIEIATRGLSNFFILKTAATPALCPSGSTSIKSSITGTNYQWQVNTGSGFVNIANNANYGGTNTNTLQVNNIPAAWAGYEYRAVVDGSNSYAVTIQFISTWTGAVSNAWENAANWSCGVVPNDYIDAVINTGTVVVNSNATCRSLRTEPGVLLTINPAYKITVAK